MNTLKEEVDYGNELQLVNKIIVQQKWDDKILPFYTTDKSNHRVINWFGDYETRANSLLRLVDSESVKEKIIESGSGLSAKDMVLLLSNCFSSPRTRLNTEAGVITVVNMSRLLEEKQNFFSVDYIDWKYGQHVDILFYFVFLLETSILGKTFEQCFTNANDLHKVTPELFTHTAISVATGFLDFFGIDKIHFVFDYFFYYFTHMYPFYGERLPDKRSELIRSMGEAFLKTQIVI